MILTVHDELLFEVPEARAPRRSPRSCASEMQERGRLNVPLTVDVGIGENWKDAKALGCMRRSTRASSAP